MASGNYYSGYTHGGAAYSGGYVTQGVASSGMYSTGQGMSPGYSAAPRPGGYDQGYVGTSVPSSYAFASRPQPGLNAPYGSDGQYASNAACTAYPPNPYSSTYTNTYNSVVTNYAASTLYSQHAAVGQHESNNSVYSSNKSRHQNFKKSLYGANKVKTQTKVQQLHYCEVCKISCAGPQTYKEHLEGQRHKKKEAQMKSGSASAPIKRGHNIGIALRCELCDVTCTGNDAYAAHIRGSKHQKVVKLHTKLGKPIPSTDPILINQKGAASKTLSAAVASAAAQLPLAAGKIKVVGTPKINFIGGGRLHTTGGGHDKVEKLEETSVTPVVTQVEPVMTENLQIQNQPQDQMQQMMETDKDCQPVGQDYVEEIKSDDGKSVSFHCKLCDCRFNDPNAKEMHLKGRRHRLQYKKKVDPSLLVDTKPSMKQRKIQEIKERRSLFKQRDQHHYWSDCYQPQGGRYGYDGHHMPPPPPLPYMHLPPSGFGHVGGPMMPQYPRKMMNSGSWDDNHILQKHSEIIPKEEELDDIHHVVQITERALKLVSDKLADEDAQAAAIIDNSAKEASDSGTAKESGRETDLSSNGTGTSNGQSVEDKTDDGHSNRVLKGRIRVGALAKNLLLNGDREVDLVVICAEKPTKTLLQRVVDSLPKQLQAVTASETFEIMMKPQDAGLSVSSVSEPRVVVNITLTSLLVRETNVPEGASAEMVKEPKQMLERQKCLDALAAVRHAKWYQGRVANLHPCPIIIRLLRDLCRRLPTWSKLNSWAVELLCERVITSAGEQLTLGEAFRHVLESISSGLMLPGGTGLFDPCEKDPVDALSYLTRQEREDITASAQHALRLIAFRQIHKILGVEPIAQRNRKRRSDAENEDALATESDLSKKVKKEVSDFAEDESVSAGNSNIQQFSNETSEKPNEA